MKEKIEKYIKQMEAKVDDLDWGLSKALLEYESKKSGILGEQRGLREAIREAKGLLNEEQV